MNKYLIETDFLFGLTPSDRYNSQVEKALKLTKDKQVELRVITSAIFEVRAVLYSRGKNPAEINRTLTLMKKKLDENNIDEEYIKFDDFIFADYLKSKHSELTFFDALHAAISERRKTPLYGADAVLKKLKFISKTLDEELI
jgi:predicted nucleic acid-binding protein